MITIPFDNSFAQLGDRFFTRHMPEPASDPSLIVWNDALAKQLGISGTTDDTTLALLFSGTSLPNGADPLAQAYAGHQFGNFVPQLGDGRALLLGEVKTDTARYDIVLKGAGRTAYSRMGDGRAWLGPVLREYIVSEAMAAMGVPSTRALAAVRTGDLVYRDMGRMPGAVLTRVAASHLRVGSFQFFAARGMRHELTLLTDYAIERHHPGANGPLGLFTAVLRKQAELVAHWLSIGFIHGVMNTDNTTISGETIDYGPCAFLDRYVPGQVYSSIDHQGRYAYHNQPDVIVWNMAQLANALILLEEDSPATLEAYRDALGEMPQLIRAAWEKRFAAKLGLRNPGPDEMRMIALLLDAMEKAGADFTNTFRSLSEQKDAGRWCTDPEPIRSWQRDWENSALSTGVDHDLARASCPAIIPRNHQIERIITAAVDHDDTPFKALLAAVSMPFETRNADDPLVLPPTEDQEIAATYCGT